MALMTALAPAVSAMAAEAYPVRPIRMIIPAGAGGVTDILGRVIAQKLSDSLGQQVIVDNRPGASGTLELHRGEIDARWLHAAHGVSFTLGEPEPVSGHSV